MNAKKLENVFYGNSVAVTNTDDRNPLAQSDQSFKFGKPFMIAKELSACVEHNTVTLKVRGAKGSSFTLKVQHESLLKLMEGINLLHEGNRWDGGAS